VTSRATVDEQLAERLVREQFRIIETGELALAATNVTPGYVNLRSVHEPLAARAGGPAALAATATWLRRAFSDIRFEIHEIAVVDGRAIAWVTLHGTNTGPFVVHDSPDGAVTQVFPPTGRQFATRQVHWFRIEGGAIAEHDAVRDDLGMAQQVGWIPPRPGYVVRMLAARRRERRAWLRTRREAAPTPAGRVVAREASGQRAG
jgi:predicted ester cyclase